jgi:hypothetical protein
MRRFALLGLLVGLMLATFGASATACLEPRGYLGISSAGPGDPVPFDITGTDPGSSYDVTAGGQTVVSGSDTGGGPGEGTSGSFTMPDFGDSPRAVNVMFNVQHEGSNWQSPETIQYVPPPPPPASSTSSKPAGTGQPAADAVAGKKSTRGRGAATPRPDEPNPAPNPASAPAPAPSAAPAPAVTPAANPARASEPEQAASKVRASEQAEQSVPDRALDAVGSTTSVGPAKVPTAGLLLMAVIFIVGTGTAAFVIYLLRRGPDPNAAIKAPAPLGHDPVEVELQEMIGEEMARKLLSDLDLGEPSVTR